jgi:hypothetical protein
MRREGHRMKMNDENQIVRNATLNPSKESTNESKKRSRK